MRKLFTACLALTVTFAIAGAQNKTPIGSTHAIDFGVYYGYGTNQLVNHAGGFMDINAAKSNLRTRLGLEIERVTGAIDPVASVELLYMAPLDNTLCFYPILGVQAGMQFYGGSVFDVCPMGGFGLEFQFNKHFGYFLQAKYKYGILETGSTFMAQTGFIFAFGPGKRAESRKLSSTSTDLTTLLKTMDAADDAAKAAEAEKAKAAAAEAAKVKAEADAHEAEVNEFKAADARQSVNSLLFPKGSAFLSQATRERIAKIAEFLNKHPEAKVELNGFADNDGDTEEENLSISRKRAEAVKRALVSYGIPEGFITINALGSSAKPTDSTETNRAVIVTTY